MSERDSTRDDDRLVFSDEPATAESRPAGYWKVLVVDDDRSVHAVTRMILADFEFAGKGLAILGAHTVEEARTAIDENPDLALVLLDVVMAEEDSGLKLVRYIREERGNRMTRIVLRTGQPGQAPERRVIVDYDINDYKLKTELTADKLFATIVAALRSYRDLLSLDHNRRGLERIIESAASLFKLQSFNEFVSGVLTQMTSLMRLDESAMYCRTSGITAKRSGEEFVIEAAIGDYTGYVRRPIREALPGEAIALVERALRERRSIYLPTSFIAYFMSRGGAENIIYMTSTAEIAAWDARLIEIFCANVSVALDNLYLNQEIENTQKEIIYTLGEVAEARSRETGHHVKRVAEYSKTLAVLAGMAEDEAEIVRMASTMHDIGKLAIPDAILSKRGPLDPGEYEVIKTHAQAGADMLRGSNRPIMRIASTIALEHQERFDGSGYPSGKKGDEISLYGRIVGIADVFDALLCERAYKRAWEIGDVLEYLQKERGRQFDPALIDLFVTNVDRMLEIRARFPD